MRRAQRHDRAMERNLDALQRKRAPDGARRRPGKSRSQDLAALDANGCRDDARPSAACRAACERSGNILRADFRRADQEPTAPLDEELGDEAPRRQDDGDSGLARLKPRDGQWINEDGHIRFSPPPGTTATLCVRTCDGYFFPMSNASSPMRFRPRPEELRSRLPGHRDAGLLSPLEGRRIGRHDLAGHRRALFASCRPPISTSRPACRDRPAAAATAARTSRSIAGRPRRAQHQPTETPPADQRRRPRRSSRCGSAKPAAQRRRKSPAPVIGARAGTMTAEPTAQGQGRRASVPSRPRSGNRSASSGPELKPSKRQPQRHEQRLALAARSLP